MFASTKGIRRDLGTAKNYTLTQVTQRFIFFTGIKKSFFLGIVIETFPVWIYNIYMKRFNIKTENKK